MNASSCPAAPCFSLSRLLGDLKAFARREPVQAMAIAVGTGLLVNLLPKRAIVGTATTLGTALLHPVLLTLGITKAMELCCRSTSGPVPPDGNTLSPSDSSRPSQWITP